MNASRPALVLLVLGGCYRPPDFIPDRPDTIPLGVEGVCAAARFATVACVLDGDTFDVGVCGEGGERIRMLGINAPEIAHAEPAECWGDEAAAVLTNELTGRDVVLSFDEHCIDPYERTLAYVTLVDELEADTAGPVTGDAPMVNTWMLSTGNARLFDEDWVDPLRRQAEIDQAEALARAQGIGLWGACPDEAP
jgi:endonuclease YncB( thermonuclease family)